MKREFIIGTRGSILALAQTEIIKKLLEEKFKDLTFKTKEIVTTGDRDLKTNLGTNETSLKSFFTKEIEQELLDKKINFAVHSMKDMPIVNPCGLILGGTPKREDNRDVFVSKSGKKLRELPENPVIGTSALRRIACIKEIRPDAIIKPIRGNIHTRLRKLKEEDYDGIVLAGAGLIRTGLQDVITEYFSYEEVMPAPAQGVIYVQCRENDTEILKMLKEITDEQTLEIVRIEREFSKIFDGGCHTPMGCVAYFVGEDIEISGMYYKNDKIYRGKYRASRKEGIEIARKLAEIIQEDIHG